MRQNEPLIYMYVLQTYKNLSDAIKARQIFEINFVRKLFNKTKIYVKLQVIAKRNKTGVLSLSTPKGCI